VADSTQIQNELLSMPAVELAGLSFRDGHADHFPILPAASLDIIANHPSDGEHLLAVAHAGGFIIH
jgi:hypothetical protein